MTLPDIGPSPLREVERLTDVGFDIGYAALAMCQAWTRLVLWVPLRGYSAAAEAAELLRARQSDGGPRHAAGAPRED